MSCRQSGEARGERSPVLPPRLRPARPPLSSPPRYGRSVRGQRRCWRRLGTAGPGLGLGLGLGPGRSAGASGTGCGCWQPGGEAA